MFDGPLAPCRAALFKQSIEIRTTAVRSIDGGILAQQDGTHKRGHQRNAFALIVHGFLVVLVNLADLQPREAFVRSRTGGGRQRFRTSHGLFQIGTLLAGGRVGQIGLLNVANDAFSCWCNGVLGSSVDNWAEALRFQ